MVLKQPIYRLVTIQRPHLGSHRCYHCCRLLCFLKGKMVVSLGWWAPSCLTPEKEPFKGDMGPNKYPRDTRCIWGWLLRLPTIPILPPIFPYDFLGLPGFFCLTEEETTSPAWTGDFLLRDSPEQWKKPWLFGLLPSYIGIIMKQYKDPY